MGTILKKFDMDAYTKRRIKELRGEKVYSEDPAGEIARYIKHRMRQLRETREAERELDKSVLGCYTIGTMGDRDGET
tara:strand:- start:1856 stop:2086 length:231 start_codon:yes stop_codon:yes gene_type:complete